MNTLKCWQQAAKASWDQILAGLAWQAKETDGSGEVEKRVRIIILERKQGDQKKAISVI